MTELKSWFLIQHNLLSVTDCRRLWIRSWFCVPSVIIFAVSQLCLHFFADPQKSYNHWQITDYSRSELSHSSITRLQPVELHQKRIVSHRIKLFLALNQIELFSSLGKMIQQHCSVDHYIHNTIFLLTCLQFLWPIIPSLSLVRSVCFKQLSCCFCCTLLVLVFLCSCVVLMKSQYCTWMDTNWPVNTWSREALMFLSLLTDLMDLIFVFHRHLLLFRM